MDFNKITVEESNGDIVLEINTVKEKKTTTFDVKGISFTLNNGTLFDYVPMLAYVAPNGSLVVATSLCEPCSGTTHFILKGMHWCAIHVVPSGFWKTCREFPEVVPNIRQA